MKKAGATITVLVENTAQGMGLIGEHGLSLWDKTIEALREFDVQRLLPLHCTGFAAAARLWKEFPGRVSICPVGTIVELIA